MREESEGMNVESALHALRRRAPLLILCVVLAAGAAYLASTHQAKRYTATASLNFTSNSLSQQLAGLPAGSAQSIASQQASNVELVRLGDTAAKTAQTVGAGLSERQVKSAVAVSGTGESSVVSIAASAGTPRLAAAIANAYAQTFVAAQQHSNRRYFASALALVDKQLAAIPKRDRFSAAAVALQNRAQTLRLLSELQYGEVQVAQEATPPTGPSSPRTKRNTALGAILGLLVGLALVFALERVGARVGSPEELERIYECPVVGNVPARGGARRGKKLDASLSEAQRDAFGLTRAHLRLIAGGGDARSIVVVGAEPGDGATLCARGLAQAAMRSGSRALLIEADLREPTLATQLGIEAGPGLPAVLRGEASIQAAVRAAASATEAAGSPESSFDVLSAGPGAVNAPELLESPALDLLLSQVGATYDVIVIDASAALRYPEALGLLGRVDAVVIAATTGHSRRRGAERLHGILAGSDAPVLGLIALGRPGLRVGSSARRGGHGAAAQSATAAALDAGAQAEQVPSTV